MDRTEQTGLGVAVVGHAALFAILSLGLVSTAKLPPISNEPMDVMFVDDVGMRSAAPEPAVEPPAPSEAPELGPSEETAPSEASPAAEPTPRSSDVPSIPRPAEKPKPKQAEALPDLGDRRRPDRNKPAKPNAKPAERQTGSRLGANFLKGIADTPKGKANTPRAAEMSPAARAGLYAAIYRQFKPCYELGSLKGTPAMSIVTVLRLRYTKDGKVAASPALVEQTGAEGAAGRYAPQMEDVARRAVLRCTPIRLPAELYDGGWDDFELRFIPEQMG